MNDERKKCGTSNGGGGEILKKVLRRLCSLTLIIQECHLVLTGGCNEYIQFRLPKTKVH